MKTPSVGEGVGIKSDLLAIPTLGQGPFRGGINAQLRCSVHTLTRQ
jgi:hypothetical protein